MKLKLTQQAELDLKRLNKLYGDENSVEFDNWNLIISNYRFV